MIDFGETRLPGKPFGLCVYGFPYLAGFVRSDSVPTHTAALDRNGMLDLTVSAGAGFFESDLRVLGPEPSEADYAGFRDAVAERDLQFVLDVPGRANDADKMTGVVEAFERTGAVRGRMVLSGILCADRSSVGGRDGWQRYLDECIAALQTITPRLEELGVKVGLENHQDASSRDLARVCREVGSPSIGVTWDVGNSLAVMETPEGFLDRIEPHLVHVHCKDYKIFPSAEGFRLVRCGLGEGVVDWAGIFSRLRSLPGVTLSLEQAAHNARHIRCYTDAYWEGLEDREIGESLAVFRLAREQASRGDYRTPLETKNYAALAAYEAEELRTSVVNAAKIWNTLDSDGE